MTSQTYYRTSSSTTQGQHLYFGRDYGSNNGIQTNNSAKTSSFYPSKNVNVNHGNNCASTNDNENAMDPQNVNNQTTDSQTMMHILKANIGTGVLAMPSAFRNVGLWPSFVLVPLIGAICIHCMNILIGSHNKLCDRFNYESLDYDQVAALGLACGPKSSRRLAKYASAIVTVFLMFTQFGFCCVYILFVVNNIQLAAFNLFALNYSTTTYLLIVFPLIAITSCTSNLKHLARISTMANILQLLGLALIFFDLLQFHTYDKKFQQETNSISGNGSNSSLPVNIIVEQGFSDALVSGLPLFFATSVYAFEGIGVVLPLIKEMQSPEHISGLNGVLNTSMSLVAILYMGVGFFGYAKYGQFVNGSITLNLPETTLNELVRLIFAIAIGLSYALQFYVPWAIVWPLIDESLFYSYRPRVARDKLNILNKLSADNEWLISGGDLSCAYESSTCERATKGVGSSPRLQHRQTTATTAADNNNENNDTTNYENDTDADLFSNASTLATSYSMSVCNPLAGSRSLQSSTTMSSFVAQPAGTAAAAASATPSAGNKLIHPTTTLEPLVEAVGLSDKAAQQARHSSSQATGASCLKQLHQAAPKRRRNRLDDVAQRRADSPQSDEPDLPEVQWRPPPRSMRGKRKLVRYTVIIVAVALTCK